ncbi:hypothetical protein GB931_05890 [Modestobacter sp. I12A-02628]|uniref:Uncharacterized protein n=1 Tax=Goekera deserti TaxID=2497753 RepID=A0A7K3WB39_9ACTN|nr:hypothetical protein [Goekera deserti]MPQ97462.1 hypothetical protein [Goekera deserti]NDI47937.1 hypothetical protein [Goekera deserti]NEL53685.1 hypothetical protein [Goekera deserti]
MPSRSILRRCTSTPTRRAVAVALLVGVPLALAVPLLPVAGGDIVAQRFWAGWGASHSGSPVDFSWYGGTPSVSYSLVTPWVMALVGVAGAGVAGTVVGSVLTGVLLARSGTRRPAAGAAVAAVMFAADQLSGRITFGMGAAAGVGALCLLTLPARTRARRVARCTGVAAAAALAGALSPVASALLLVPAGAWLLAGGRAGVRARLPESVCLAGGALAPLLAMTLLGAAQGLSGASSHQVLGMALALLVVLAAARDHPAVRVGVLLTLLALVLVWVLPDPVGSNLTRIVLLFAPPLVVAIGPRRPVELALAAALVVWVLPPLVPADLNDDGPPVATARADGLLAALRERTPVGRVEVVPLNSHLESQAVAEEFPIARGWLRQVDMVRNPLFYDGSLDPASYRAWLLERGVGYVALPRARVDWPDHREAAIVRAGQPWLQQVWRDADWTLYAVQGGDLVQGPATLVSSDREGLVLDVEHAGVVDLSLFWNRALTVRGPDGCLRPGDGEGRVRLDAAEPGTYRVTSAWLPSGHC